MAALEALREFFTSDEPFASFYPRFLASQSAIDDASVLLLQAATLQVARELQPFMMDPGPRKYFSCETYSRKNAIQLAEHRTTHSRLIFEVASMDSQEGRYSSLEQILPRGFVLLECGCNEMDRFFVVVVPLDGRKMFGDRRQRPLLLGRTTYERCARDLLSRMEKVCALCGTGQGVKRCAR